MKQMLFEQFSSCYDRNGWFVAVRNAVEGLAVDEAAWKPVGADNSIWELVAHLRYDNNAYLQRFKGIDFQHTASTNEETFDPSKDSWSAELASFDAVMGEFRTLLENADESKFDDRVLGKPEFTWSQVIVDLNAHNAYHAGQILLIRKLQGSWDRTRGVS